MQNRNVQIAHTIELEDVFKGKSVITKYNPARTQVEQRL